MESLLHIWGEGAQRIPCREKYFWTWELRISHRDLPCNASFLGMLRGDTVTRGTAGRMPAPCNHRDAKPKIKHNVFKMAPACSTHWHLLYVVLSIPSERPACGSCFTSRVLLLCTRTIHYLYPSLAAGPSPWTSSLELLGCLYDDREMITTPNHHCDPGHQHTSLKTDPDDERSKGMPRKQWLKPAVIQCD